MATHFKLPELGENIETIQVVKVLVSVGDTVVEEQAVLELETDKATVEVPSSIAGVVTAVHVREGDEIRVGQTILECEGEGAQPEPASAPVAGEQPTGEKAPEASHTALTTEVETSGTPAGRSNKPLPKAGHRVPAAPSVRVFAREIGVDILEVTGSGPHGRLSIEDVKRYAKRLNEGRSPAADGASAVAMPSLPDFERWGDVKREKMSVIRRKTAEHMAMSWAHVPHVTIFDTADITEIEGLRKRYAAKAEAAGGKLTMGAMVVKIVAQALKVFPKFNASVDMAGREVIFKHYCNVGVAVDTDRGLMVPVIRDTDRKSMIEIAVELLQIAGRAREGKIGVEELEGGTFTVTNLGRTCGTFFTPIINHPEVAILGVGRAHDEPAPTGVGTRKVLPLSLSFDHRLVDGADGVKFLGWIIEALGEPLLLSLEG